MRNDVRTNGLAHRAVLGLLAAGGAAGIERVDALQERALGAIDRPKGEMHLVPQPRLTLAGEHGVLLRAAQNEPGRDVEDAEAHARSSLPHSGQTPARS